MIAGLLDLTPSRTKDRDRHTVVRLTKRAAKQFFGCKLPEGLLVLFPMFLPYMFLLVSVLPQLTDVPPTPAPLQKKFAEFAVTEKFTGKPSPVVLSRPEHRMFRTMLRNGAKEGPNFAGHFTVVQWGCGTNCLSGAIVDAKTGEVYQLPALGKERADYFESEWLHFRPDSRLMIVCSHCREWLIGDCDQRYFVWDGSSFTEVDRMPHRDPHGH